MAVTACCPWWPWKSKHTEAGTHAKVSLIERAQGPARDPTEPTYSCRNEEAPQYELNAMSSGQDDLMEREDADLKASPGVQNTTSFRTNASTLRVPGDWPPSVIEHLSSLGIHDINHIASPDYEGVVRQLEGKCADRQLQSKAEKLDSILVPIASFLQGTSTVLQAVEGAQVAQVAWGCLHVFVSIALRFTKAIDLIAETLEDLNKCLPRLTSFSSLFPTEGVKNALSDIRAICVELILRIAVFLKQKSSINMIKLAWSAFDRELQTLRASIERRRKDFNEEIELAHMRSVQQNNQRFEKRETAHVRALKMLEERLATPTKPREHIPCRLIPFQKNTRFFSRPTITAKIEAHLQPSRPASEKTLGAFLLHGLGGSGKTQLAMDFVYSHWEDYSVILWISADSEQTLAEDFHSAAKSLGILQEEDTTSVIKTLHRWLRETEFKWLLVFDNADEPNRVVKYCPCVPTGSIIVTSRSPMFDVGFLTARCEVELLSHDEGGRMLFAAVDSGYQLGEENTLDLAKTIATELDGIPLAISQMAGYILQTKMPMDRFLSLYRIREKAEALNSGNTSLDHYQYRHTLKTVWQISYGRLTKEAYTLICLASFFFPEQIPEVLFYTNAPKILSTDHMDIPGSVMDVFSSDISFESALSDLMSESLLRRNAKTRVLQIHRQVQASVFGQMRQNEKAEFLSHFASAVQMLYSKFPRQSPLGEPIPEWPVCEYYTKHVLFLLDRYEENETLHSSEALVSLTELFCDCGVYLWGKGRLPDALRLAKASIEVANQVLEPHDCLRAQPYALLGCIYLRSEGGANDAEDALRTALSIRESNAKLVYGERQKPIDVDIQLANAYSNLGMQRKQVGEYEEAARLHYKSLEIKQKYPKDDMDFLLALSYSNLGKVRKLQGRLQDAADLFHRSVTTMKRLGQEMLPRKANFMCDQAEIEENLGNTGHSRLIFQEAIDILRRTVGEATYTGYACYRFAASLYRQKDYREALLNAERAVVIFESTGLLLHLKLACSWCLMGLIYGRLGNDRKAEDYESRARSRYVEATGNEMIERGEDAWKRYESFLVHD